MRKIYRKFKHNVCGRRSTFISLSSFIIGYDLHHHAQGGMGTNQALNHPYPAPILASTVAKETFSGNITSSWTVEEQIYKSKMWLQQRNQSMLPKP